MVKKENNEFKILFELKYFINKFFSYYYEIIIIYLVLNMWLIKNNLIKYL